MIEAIRQWVKSWVDDIVALMDTFIGNDNWPDGGSAA